MAESIDIIIRIVNQTKASLTAVAREIKTVSREADSLNKDTSKRAVAGLRTWRTELEKTTKSVQSLHDVSQSIVDISKKFLIAGVAMGAAVIFPIKQAGEFESAMAKVKAIMTDISEDTFERMKEQARSLGETTRYTATQAAGAFTFLAMAGLNAAEAMEALPGTLQLAAAGNLDLATAADLATNVLSGLGFAVDQLGRVNDVLAKAASRSNTSVMEIGEAMKIAGPAAKGSNEAFEAVVAVLGGLANAGIKGAEGGNAVKRMLILLQNPTKNAKDELEKLNVPLTDSEGKFRGLIPVLQDLGAAQLDLSSSAKIFGMYTGAAAVAAAGQAAEMGGLTKELENAKGAAEAMAKAMQDTMPGALTRLKSAVDGFILSVVEPLLNVLKDVFISLADIVSMMTALVNAMGPVGPALLGITILLAVLVTSAGGLGLVVAGIVKVFAYWRSVMLLIAPTLSLIKIAVAGTITQMSTLSGLLGLLSKTFIALKVALVAHPILAIGAVLAGLYVYIKQLTPAWKELNEEAEKLRIEADKVKSGFEKLYNIFKDTEEGSEEQEDAAKKLKNELIELAKENLNISEAALKAAASIDSATGKILDSGKALEEFDLTVIRNQFEAMAKEAVAASAKMEAGLKRGEIFPLNPLKSFIQGLGDLNSIFFSMFPGIDSLSERYARMGQESSDAMKAGKAFAESHVNEMMKLQMIDPSLGLREFETYIKSLGPMSEQMASFYFAAFLRIKEAQTETAQAGTDTIRKSLDEQNVMLFMQAAEQKRILLELQDAHIKARAAAAVDPNNAKNIEAQNEAYRKSIQAVDDYVKAVNALRDSDLKLAKEASDKKVRILEDEIFKGIVTKENGELEMLRIVAESAKAEADIKGEASQRIAATIREGEVSYANLSAAAKKSAEETFKAQAEALDKYEAKLRETYEKAREEVKKYAEEVIRWDAKLAELNMSTEDKIRNARRKTMTEYEQWLDKRSQAEEKMQAARAALEEGNYSLAEKLAKQAESLYGDLATSVSEGVGEQKRVTLSIEEGTNAAIQGYGAVKTVLEDVYNTQRDIAADSKSKWEDAADGIERALDDITHDREASIDLKLEGLVEAENNLEHLSRDRTSTITVVTQEAHSSGGAVGMFAGGGQLPGFGGGDKVNALLEAGEYIIRKEAVKKYGSWFFNMMNGMRLKASDMGSAISGRLSSLQPRLGYQTGGQVSALSNMGRIELAIGANAYPVIANVDVIQELKIALEREGLMRTN